MKKFDELNNIELNEGLYDPNIFKAFFLAGGPGSGKTFVTRSAFGGTGLRMINSDNAFEVALKKNNLSLKMPEDESEARDIVRARAKATTGNIMDLSIKGRLGMVVDGTGRDYDKIKTQKAMLDQLGYDCYMIFVNTSLDVALERNRRRERTVPEYITTKSWNETQGNMGKYQRLFGMDKFIVVDNNKSDFELTTLTMTRVSKIVNKYLKAGITNHIAKQWVKKELEAKRR